MFSRAVPSYTLNALYRSGLTSLDLSDKECSAYIATRMPATYAAVLRCLKRLPPSFSPTTILDIGSGPGTALWAASTHFTSIESIHAIEPHAPFAEEQKRLLAKNTSLREKHTLFQETFDAFAASRTSSPYDLVMAAYVAGEMVNLETFVRNVRRYVEQYFLVILPGTPKNFRCLLQIRDLWIEMKGGIYAPCPSLEACPLEKATHDWCHESVRLPRSQDHKRLKGGALGYEDEKFCYLILTPEPSLRLGSSRIMHTPKKRSGHVIFDLCTPQGFAEKIISARDKTRYKNALKKEWGDDGLS